MFTLRMSGDHGDIVIELNFRPFSFGEQVLVDEYQDTNLVQYEIVKHLVSHSRRLCVVGDDDQSIYGWRGAVASNILRFDQHFHGAHMIALTQNYRSTNYILRAANHIIENNEERHAKTLWSAQIGRAHV